MTLSPARACARPRARTLPALAAAILLAAGGAPALAQPAAFGGPKMLIHGNYCGPGNNAPLPPVDALDAACARHDACTPTGGLPSPGCNLRLQQEAELISRDARQPDDLRALAGLVAAGATVIPSAPVAAVPPRTAPTVVATRVDPAPGAVQPMPTQQEPAAVDADDDDAE
ncbi:hypothetical protein Q8W71_19070 [Methylobacterium sp. NEAU 140]|uniref:hypothetical protein n=1 Tax=Methylobacterium sp. NEAU 140 TaxID=3064945 RepID=UPI0027359110|nr:hypothetical protein [Methylobacterium sp. NEAU 140]MDP4024734.1 hypothetical protein [Methylobacterium sp. NEAU 140]